jgi:hypothetical protein
MIDSTRPIELTDQDVEAFLVLLLRHFHEPVQPLSRYWEKLTMWAGAMSERAAHLKRTLYQALDSKDPKKASKAREEYQRELEAPEPHDWSQQTRRQRLVEELRGYEDMAEHVEWTFHGIDKSEVFRDLVDLSVNIERPKPATEEELTPEEAEALLVVLSRHFKEPVRPINRYCDKLRAWATTLSERSMHLKQMLYPGLDSKDTEQWNKVLEEYRRDMAGTDAHGDGTERQRLIEKLRSYEKSDEHVHRTFLAIGKSNLLARILYSGEKMRTQRCPEHKGRWTGIEWADNACPHKCQLTGWVQEQEDMGKPLPGVMAVQMVPTGEPDQVTVIRSVTGEVLGKARIVLRSEDLPKRLG